MELEDMEIELPPSVPTRADEEYLPALRQALYNTDGVPGQLMLCEAKLSDLTVAVQEIRELVEKLVQGVNVVGQQNNEMMQAVGATVQQLSTMGVKDMLRGVMSRGK